MTQPHVSATCMHAPAQGVAVACNCGCVRSVPLGRLCVHAPVPVYRFGMVEADTAKLLRREHNKIILRWLGSANPPLNAMLVKSTLDNERCPAACVCLPTESGRCWSLCRQSGAARVGLQGDTCTLGHERGPAVRSSVCSGPVMDTLQAVWCCQHFLAGATCILYKEGCACSVGQCAGHCWPCFNQSGAVVRGLQGSCHGILSGPVGNRWGCPQRHVEGGCWSTHPCTVTAVPVDAQSSVLLTALQGLEGQIAAG